MNPAHLATAATLALLVSNPAHAVSDTLQNLIGGATLTEQDVVFANFMFNDHGPVNLNPAAVTVETIVVGNEINLQYNFGSHSFGGNEEWEYDFSFDASIIPPSTRQILGVSTGIFAKGINGDSYVEIGSSNALNDFVSSLDNMGPHDLGPSNAAPLDPSSITYDWYTQAGAFDSNASGFLQNVGYAIRLDGPYVPPTPTVPLPASLPLLLAGMAGFGLVARRRGAANG